MRRIELKVVSLDNMTNVDSDSEEFSFALIEGMYRNGDGVGCQVNDETKRDAIERLGTKIAEAVKGYREATA